MKSLGIATNHRFSSSTSRFIHLSSTTGSTCIRRWSAAAEKRHLKRADLISTRTVMSPPIVLDQSILGTFLYVLGRSGNGVSVNRSKKNRGLVFARRNLATEEESDTDVIIVGAGVAGAALAHTLGKEGRRVHVIERDLSKPDRIVGELLQPGGYLKLIELGLEDCVKKIDAQRVLGYALFKDGKHTILSYPLETFDSDVAGRSFHNGRFVQRMREKATSLPNYFVD